eukprot:260497_1
MTTKYKRITYRVRSLNESFTLYEFYQPTGRTAPSYSAGCEALNTIDGKKYIIRKYRGVFDDIKDARRILREIKLMMHLCQQDILHLINVIPPESTEQYTFNEFYTISPKIETTMANVIRSKQKLTNRHYQFIMYQMLRGIHYLHSANVMHRDLKPENILINGADCNIQITDFALASMVCCDDIEQPVEYVVTRWYRAPELMCCEGYNEKIDIWSLGCIFVELILRKPLFIAQNYLEQLKKIFELMGIPKDISWIRNKDVKQWICTKINSNSDHNGISITDILTNTSRKSEYLWDNGIKLLENMLLLTPIDRYSASECLRHPFFNELYRVNDEVICDPFELSLEFNKSIEKEVGARHEFYDMLSEFERLNSSKSCLLYRKNVEPLVYGFVRNLSQMIIPIDVLQLLLLFCW